MGADFVKEATRRAKKGWRNGGNDLKHRNLFDRLPPAPEKTVLLRCQPQCGVKPGETLTLQERDGGLAGFSGLAQVGDTPNVPPAVQRTLKQFGYAAGFVTDVCSPSAPVGQFE